jgi:hypothetical protein
MTGKRIRYLLADEVGLCKTIEAGLIQIRKNVAESRKDSELLAGGPSDAQRFLAEDPVSGEIIRHSSGWSVRSRPDSRPVAAGPSRMAPPGASAGWTGANRLDPASTPALWKSVRTWTPWRWTSPS